MNNNIGTSTVIGAVAATAGVLAVLRAIKRSYSPVIQAKLKCRCGKVQGEVCAKVEDSLRLHCYCKDCRNYANYVAKLGGEKTSSMIYTCGETHLVQVCKNCISIQQGKEYLKVARQGPNKGMFRYFTSCCNTPIMNVYDFLGFVGVFEDNLDSEREKFAGQWMYCPQEASKKPLENPLPLVPGHRFLWNVFRYLPWAKSGPFDYSLKPVFWGEDQKQA